MKILFSLLFAGITATGFAQSDTLLLPGNTPDAKYAPLNKESSNELFLQKLRDGNKKEKELANRENISALLKSFQKQPSLIDNMPNAMAVQPFPSSNDIYKGNNREGFDIYESRIDRMPVLKPDSVNTAQLTRRK
ncbi:MAG: hypothetical protein JWQ30_2362 [Sediminibacterium sp.]|nr:hypothetical protein [Sediminibacterium sp.]